MNQTIDGFLYTDDKTLFDLHLIHGFLKSSYWAKGIPLEIVRKSVDHSLCCAVFKGERQVAFGRAVTDYATFAYLADIFVIEEYRGKGISKSLVAFLVEHPELQGLRRWVLVTWDAHNLYRKFGFRELAKPETYMEIVVPDIYAGEKK